MAVLVALAALVGVGVVATVVVVALPDGGDEATVDTATGGSGGEPDGGTLDEDGEGGEGGEGRGGRQGPRKPDPRDVLERNDLYDVPALTDAGCAAGSQVALDGLPGVTSYYESVKRCLDRTWRQVADAGYDHRAPGLEVFAGSSRSPCGDGLTYSFYCPSNETIYMYADEIVQPWNDYPTDYSHGLTRLSAAHTIAHEYGHHLQQVAGIFETAYGTLGRSEAERRTELQASCLGNAWLSSQRAAYPVEPYWDQQPLWRFITRLPRHGTQANQQLWTDRGYRSARTGDCNTFTAPAAEVR